VTSSGGNSYEYDPNGNMTSGAGRTIEYNQENRPVKVTVGSSITQFTYDAGGSRVKKTSGGVTTTYVSSLYECVTGAAGTACTKYISAGGQRVAMKDSTSTLYFHGDHLGSTNIITEKQPDGSVQIAQALYYSPFGKTRSGSTNTAGGTRYRYTGQEIDSETADANGNALYNYGARLYDPALGRFIMADSIVPNSRNPQSLNRYSYVRNNPINLVDPTGHTEGCPSYLTCTNTQGGQSQTRITSNGGCQSGCNSANGPAVTTATGPSGRSYQFQIVATVWGTPILTPETAVAYQAYVADLNYEKFMRELIREANRNRIRTGMSSMDGITTPLLNPFPPQAEDNGVLSLFGITASAETALPVGSSGTPEWTPPGNESALPSFDACDDCILGNFDTPATLPQSQPIMLVEAGMCDACHYPGPTNPRLTPFVLDNNVIRPDFSAKRLKRPGDGYYLDASGRSGADRSVSQIRPPPPPPSTFIPPEFFIIVPVPGLLNCGVGPCGDLQN
jgi:RHS repeat-associated protein